MYPQKDYGGPFEIQIIPVDIGPDEVDWIASRTVPARESWVHKNRVSQLLPFERAAICP